MYMEDIQAEGQTQGRKTHWSFIIVLIVIILLVAVFWSGSRSTQPAYMKAANAPAENPGLTGVSDEYRAALEAARTAPAAK